jgi:hypothetical protein
VSACYNLFFSRAPIGPKSGSLKAVSRKFSWFFVTKLGHKCERAKTGSLLTVLELLPVEVDVAKVEDGGDDAEDDILLLQGEAQHLGIR